MALKGNPKDRKVLVFLAIVIFAGLVLLGTFSADHPSVAHATESNGAARARIEKQHEEALVDARVALKAFRRRLLNPDSLKIAEAYRMGDDSICISYRAQNAVGGPSAGDAVYSYVDGELSADGDRTFNATWKHECRDRQPVEDVTNLMQ